MTTSERMWREAKKKYLLSRETVEMAQQLGLDPKKLDHLVHSHPQKVTKHRLPDMIRTLYAQKKAQEEHR